MVMQSIPKEALKKCDFPETQTSPLRSHSNIGQLLRINIGFLA